MMTESDVIEVVGRLERAGLNYWLDGGWGVDANLGEQTRPHDDLDMVAELRALEEILSFLEELGFTLTLDERPTRLVLADETDRRIDLHPVTRDAQGNGVQSGAGPGGGDAFYPASGFEGVGSIGGQRVTCLTPQLLVLHHQGYEPLDKDRHNVRALCERFDIPLPAAYADD
jgi:lincosamide nucleotidyltransferase A/C/D/E